MKKILAEINALEMKTAKISDASKEKILKTKGNIITFKKPQRGEWANGTTFTQIMAKRLVKTKDGQFRLEGEFGRESNWFSSKKELFDAIDWDFMEDAQEFTKKQK
jgi:hypothetical protein